MVILLWLFAICAWCCDVRYFSIPFHWEHSTANPHSVLGLGPTQFVLQDPATYGLNELYVTYSRKSDCVELEDKCEHKLFCDIRACGFGIPGYPMSIGLCKAGVYRMAQVSVCDVSPRMAVLLFVEPRLGVGARVADLDLSSLDLDVFMQGGRTWFSPGKEAMAVTRDLNLCGPNGRVFFVRGVFKYDQLNEVVVYWGVRAQSGSEEIEGDHKFSFIL